MKLGLAPAIALLAFSACKDQARRSSLPEFFGFYLASTSGLQKLTAQTAVGRGNILEAVTGVAFPDGPIADSGRPLHALVYQPNVDPTRLRLSLLGYAGHVSIESFLGTSDVAAAMYVERESIPIQVGDADPRRRIYRLVSDRALAPGAYALHQDSLGRRSALEAAAGLLVYPFRILPGAHGLLRGTVCIPHGVPPHNLQIALRSQSATQGPTAPEIFPIASAIVPAAPWATHPAAILGRTVPFEVAVKAGTYSLSLNSADGQELVAAATTFPQCPRVCASLDASCLSRCGNHGSSPAVVRSQQITAGVEICDPLGLCLPGATADQIEMVIVLLDPDPTIRLNALQALSEERSFRLDPACLHRLSIDDAAAVRNLAKKLLKGR